MYKLYTKIVKTLEITIQPRLKHLLSHILLLAAIVVGYDLFYFLLYNILHYDRYFPYSEVSKNLSLYLYNLVPILLLTVSNYCIVFKPGIMPARFRLKSGWRWLVWIVATVAASFIALYIVNVGFVVVAEYYGLRSKIAWPGTILCNMLLLYQLNPTRWRN